MKIIMTCAGTAGHINPALAMADMIKNNIKDSEILFIGTFDGLENDLVKRAGYKIKNIRTGKLLRRLTFKNIKGIYNAYLGIFDAKKILKEEKVDLVIGTGGYICIPVMLASKSLKIKYMLHESNAYPGLAIKLLYKKSSCTMVGFDDTKKRLNNHNNVVVTGTPNNMVKVQEYDRLKLRQEMGLDLCKKIILVTGGSQGAKYINNCIIDLVKNKLDETMYFIISVGMKNYDNIIERIKEIESELNIDLSKYLKIEKYIYDIQKMYIASDVCITRAGALTLNELIECAKPSILIPFPYATENHQYYNAKVLEDANACILIEENKLDYNILYDKINYLDSDKLEEMSNNLLKFQDDKVNDKILNEIMKALQGDI